MSDTDWNHVSSHCNVNPVTWARLIRREMKHTCVSLMQCLLQNELFSMHILISLIPIFYSSKLVISCTKDYIHGVLKVSYWLLGNRLRAPGSAPPGSNSAAPEIGAMIHMIHTHHIMCNRSIIFHQRLCPLLQFLQFHAWSKTLANIFTTRVYHCFQCSHQLCGCRCSATAMRHRGRFGVNKLAQ